MDAVRGVGGVAVVLHHAAAVGHLVVAAEGETD